MPRYPSLFSLPGVGVVINRKLLLPFGYRPYEISVVCLLKIMLSIKEPLLVLKRPISSPSALSLKLAWSPESAVSSSAHINKYPWAGMVVAEGALVGNCHLGGMDKSS